jgi:heme-degrading monooxygenase HmoA
MFARTVSIHLKSNMLSDYTLTFEKEVLPLLRKQNGFKDEITFSNPGGTEVTAISLWDNKANAEAYNSKAYPEVLKALGRFIEGTPKVQAGDVVNSTFHKIAAGVAA